jgi:hypothetical protein
MVRKLLKKQIQTRRICGPLSRSPHVLYVGIAILWAMTGCDVLPRLKTRLQRQSVPIDVAPPASSTAARLTVNVVPASGITIVLDGRPVADRSPYLAVDLAAGAHMLEVRGMGYYPVTIPLDLPAQGPLTVPVALRVRPPVQAEGDLPPGPLPPQRPVQGPSLLPPPPTTIGVGSHVPLPAGARPMLLTVTCTPPGPLVVDGATVAGDLARLIFGTGQLNVGSFAMRYRIFPGHVLELRVPHDNAAWFKDGDQLKATSLLRLEGQPIRLRRVDAQGRSQETVLHRVE